MQDEEAFWNKKAGRRIYLVVDYVPLPFIEKIAGNNALALSRIRPTARRPACGPVRIIL